MNEYIAWLGPAADDLHEQQLDDFTAAVDAYRSQPHVTARDPEDEGMGEYQEEDDAAMSAILQTILGEDTLEDVAERARRARLEHQAWVRATVALGESERSTWGRARVAPMTVRKWLGK